MTMRSLAGVLGLAAIALLTGCAGFFPPNTTTTTTTTSSTTGDYVYVVNQTSDTLTGFAVGSGALTSLGSVALTAGLAPASVAVTRADTVVDVGGHGALSGVALGTRGALTTGPVGVIATENGWNLYVGGNGAISCFAIGTGGALTAVTGGGGTATANFVSLDTSPDGQWLLGLDSITLTVYVYRINTSTGALTLNSTTTYGVPGAGAVSQRMVKVAPNGDFVAIALGPGGDIVFPFTTTTGLLGSGNSLAIPAAYSDNAVAFDATSSYLLIARGVTGTGLTSGIATYTVNSTGALSGVQTLAASGNAPYSLVLDSTGTYVYTANRGDGTISGYTLNTGMLTALASSPFASGLAVTALARDNSGKYIIAVASGGSSDVTLYGFDALTAGKLDPLAVSASGTDPAGSVAVAATF